MKKLLLSLSIAVGVIASGNITNAKTTKKHKTVKETPTSSESTETTTTEPTPEVAPPPPPEAPAPVVVEEKQDDRVSKGGLFLEPSIFYEFGKGHTDWHGVLGSDGDLKGPGIGLRFGFHISDVIFIAADGMYSKPDFKTDNFNFDTKQWLAGVTVGAQTPLYGIRVWGSYLPFGQIELDGRGTSPNVRFTDPKIWKLGAGIRYRFLSFNLEYLNGKYDSVDILNVGPLTGNYTSATATRNSWIASVSFPLSL